MSVSCFYWELRECRSLSFIPHFSEIKHTNFSASHFISCRISASIAINNLIWTIALFSFKSLYVQVHLIYTYNATSSRTILWNEIQHRHICIKDNGKCIPSVVYSTYIEKKHEFVTQKKKPKRKIKSIKYITWHRSFMWKNFICYKLW